MKHRKDFSKWPGEPTYLGENVAYGYSVTDVMNGWMNSKGHRDNILKDEFNAIGIGVAADSSGRLFYRCSTWRQVL